jgi:hypothetical protein
MVLGAVLWCGACLRVQAAAPGGDELRGVGEQVLAELEFAYASRLPARFLALTALDFEKAPAFQAALETYFLRYRLAQVHFTIVSITDHDEFASIDVRWYKMSVDQAGATAMREGRAELVFKKENRLLRLKGIRGDNPFF